ncbi:MAG: hypothetical protein ACTSV7_11330 [Candidatus Baldrarchaeia archaeon]
MKSISEMILWLTTAYWGSTVLADQMINIGKSVSTSIIDLIISETPSYTAGDKPMWYTYAPPELAFPWALLPALAITYILMFLVNRRNINISAKDCVNLGCTFSGLFLLFIGLLSRFTTYPISGYTYLSFFLLIPPSIEVINQIISMHRLFSSLIIVSVLTIAAFYSIQDPAISPDIHKIILTADKRSWQNAKVLSAISTNIVTGGPVYSKGLYTDQRVAIGLSTYFLKNNIQTVSLSQKSDWRLIVLASDQQGIRWRRYRIIITDWDTYSIVFTDGIYLGYLMPGAG